MSLSKTSIVIAKAHSGAPSFTLFSQDVKNAVQNLKHIFGYTET